jgi:hypothetical protein
MWVNQDPTMQTGQPTGKYRVLEEVGQFDLGLPEHLVDVLGPEQGN